MGGDGDRQIGVLRRNSRSSGADSFLKEAALFSVELDGAAFLLTVNYVLSGIPPGMMRMK